jgi:hypothetical protein
MKDANEKVEMQEMAQKLADNVATMINKHKFSISQIVAIKYPKQLLLELLITELEARV